MRISDKRYFGDWLKQLKPLDPAALWSDFLARDDLSGYGDLASGQIRAYIDNWFNRGEQQ